MPTASSSAPSPAGSGSSGPDRSVPVAAKNPDPKVAPHPGCNDCSRIVHDEVTYRRDGDPEEPMSRYAPSTDWNASTVFHTHCETCAARADTEAPLCASCRHLGLPHLSFCLPVKDQPLMISIPEPQQESIKTCPLCGLFDRISKGEHSPAAEPLKYPLYISATKWRSQEVQWRVRGRDIFSFANHGCAFIVVQEAAKIPRDEESDTKSIPVQPIAGTVQDWIPLKRVVKTCLARHAHCNAQPGFTLPPNLRVIDIKNSRIIPLPSSASYVALSYVWAQAQDGRISSSTRDTIGVFSDTLDISGLPTMIRDAITACEKIGEQYLWVDRYCIVQDDDEDRSLQIHAMADIYSAAKLIIVAAVTNAGSGGIAGISKPRKPQIRARFSGSQVDIQRGHLFDGIRLSPWNSRGWTYQEALLNHRKLFFTDSQVYFECGLRITHEENLAYSSFDPSLHDKRRYIGATTSLTYDDLSHGHERINTGVRRYSHEPPWSAYQRHLERYRTRKLSHMSDLLNAFTGILHALYGERGVYYGLPLSELDRALLWTPRRSYGPRRKEVEDVAVVDFPSWSWASAPTAIPTFEETSITHTLCVWFRPIGKGPPPKLELIFPIDAVQAETSGDDLKEKAVSDFLESLRPEWQHHAEFWSGMLGDAGGSQWIHNAELRMLERVPKDLELRDGMLVTRAQVARLRVEVPDLTRIGAVIKCVIRNEQGQQVGSQIYDHNGQVAKVLRAGENVFAFAALSVGKPPWGVGLESLPEIAVFRDEEGKRSGQTAVVNVLVVKKDGDHYRRIGLGMVYMKAWVELRVSFEAVLLV